MYRIDFKTQFSAAHQIRRYPGDCGDLHGHNFKVKVSLKTNELDKLGIGFDFRELKKLTNEIVDKLDHQNLNNLPQFKELNPTSENIARYIYHEIKAKFKLPIELDFVQVWEGDSCSASYSE